MEPSGNEQTKLSKTNNIIIGMAYSVDLEKKRDQDRTRLNKGLFLDYFAKMRVVSSTCAKVGISGYTFYEWKKNDPDFAKALEEVIASRNDAVEDVLMGKIFAEHDAHCTTFYLKSRHGQYKPKLVTEVIVGERTLEDLLDDDEKKYENKSGVDSKTPENSGQTGNSPKVQPKPGADVLLGKANQAKPDSKGPAKGAK